MLAGTRAIFMPNGHAARSFAAWPRGWDSSAFGVQHRSMEKLPDA